MAVESDAVLVEREEKNQNRETGACCIGHIMSEVRGPQRTDRDDGGVLRPDALAFGDFKAERDVS